MLQPIPEAAVRINPFIEVAMHQFIQDVHQTALKKGWWDTPRSVGDCIALIHSELSEALEEAREPRSTIDTHTGHLKFTVELADCIIRICDMAGYYGLDLGAALLQKALYNNTRPHRHGEKRF